MNTERPIPPIWDLAIFALGVAVIPLVFRAALGSWPYASIVGTWGGSVTGFVLLQLRLRNADRHREQLLRASTAQMTPIPSAGSKINSVLGLLLIVLALTRTVTELVRHQL